MCGIAGFTGNNIPKIKNIISKISHRGPDSLGYFADKKVTLGHARLSIIDLSEAGFQPMYYTQKQGAFSEKFNTQNIGNEEFAIVLNGEIYNFKEIKKQLSEKGLNFTTKSDTEVILAAYSYWGQDCVQHFNGMWAFAIYDFKTQEIFLSRDRFGQKPLYYSTENEQLIFGSTLKVFFEYGTEKKIDKESLNHFMIFGMMPTKKSIISGIKKLPPAHNLLYSLSENKIKSLTNYYKTVFTEKKITKNEAQKELLNLLKKSIKRRLIADVPTGAFLSGGVDSSAIVYFMQKELGNLKTFSVGFDYDDFNEAEQALLIAKKFKTEHHQINFTANDVKKLINTLPTYFDEPLGDASLIPATLVSKVASQHVKVVLSGTGADEIFAGYSRYTEYQKLLKFINMPKLIKATAVKSFKLKTGDSDKASKLKILLNSKKEELYLKLFSNSFRGENEFDIDFEKITHYKNYFRSNNFLNNALHFEQQIYLPEDLLIKEDRATMASSIEGRIPFLDYQLVDFANSLPEQLKLNGNTGKYILKKALEGILPDDILYRKKQGFGVPLKHYFRKELKVFTEKILFDFDKFDYYDKNTLRKLWNKHQAEESDYSHVFWSLIIFNKWYEMYIA